MANNITNDNLSDYANTAEDLGVVSSHKNMVISELLQQVANFLRGKPDASAEDLARFVGAKQSNMDALIDWHNGLNTTKDDILFADGIRPFAPHHRQPSGYPIEFSVVTLVTMIVLALRLYSRIKLMGGVRHYDYIMVFGFFITLGIGMMNLITQLFFEPFTGWYDNTTLGLEAQQAVGLANMIMYPIAQVVIKSSLLLFYWQLSDWKTFRLGIVGTWVFLVLAMLSCMFTYIFSCLPVEYWKTDAWFQYYCPMNYISILVVEAALTIVTDVVIWLLPIFLLVTKLQLHRRERIWAVLTFGLGTIACFASGFRLLALKNDYNEEAGQTSPSRVHIFTSLELNLTIICASAPALRALIVSRAPKLLGSSDSSLPISRPRGSDADEELALPTVEVATSYGHPIRRYDPFAFKPLPPIALDAPTPRKGSVASTVDDTRAIKDQVQRAYAFAGHKDSLGYGGDKKVEGRDMV